MSRLRSGPGPIYQGSRPGWSKAAGYTSEVTWIGSEDECKGYLPVVRASEPISVNVDRIGESPDWQITATYGYNVESPVDPDNNPPINTYELIDNQLQSSIMTNQIALAKFGTTARMSECSDYIKMWEKDTKTRDQARTLIAALTNLGSGDSAYGERFFDLYAGSTTHFMDFHYVFRRTLTCFSAQQHTAAFTGVKQVWTSAQVTAFESVASVPFFVLPANQQWFKLPPNVTAAWGQRTQISYEYWGADLWTTDLYPVYTG